MGTYPLLRSRRLAVSPLRRLTFFQTPKKVSKKGLPHHSVPRLGSACPLSGIASWARREGPSMAQRGYPGIHAGMPTTQCLRSAIVVNGAWQIKSWTRRPEADLFPW